MRNKVLLQKSASQLMKAHLLRKPRKTLAKNQVGMELGSSFQIGVNSCPKKENQNKVKKSPKSKAPKVPKVPRAKKPKKTLVEIPAEDWLMAWPSIKLNAEKTEPKVGLSAAISKAKADCNYKMEGHRLFGRRLVLKDYSKGGANITKDDVQHASSFGVFEVSDL
jgi:hypothetical protein